MFFQTDDWVFCKADAFTPQIQVKFELKNIKKVKAVRMNMWGAHKLPDVIATYHKDKTTNLVRVPLGIAGFPGMVTGYTPTLIPAAIPTSSFTPYSYQTEAVNQLLLNRYGLLHASTGSGKTLMAMMISDHYQVRTLIVCKDLTLMKQFVADIKTQLGLTVEYVGGTMTKKYKDWINSTAIVVSTIQSIDKVNTKDFSLVILDEVHTYLGADARREWVGSLTNPYVYGLTWTPIVNDVDDRVFPIYLWPTTRCEVIHITPNYAQVPTGFKFDLFDISDFHELKSAMYADEERNNLITQTVIATLWNNKGLVFTEYTEHAMAVAKSLTEGGIETHILIGEVKADERERIKEYVKNATTPQIIVWSVKIIGTGFDLPELSRAYLTTSIRFKWELQQYLGRIIRKHPTKPQPIFYDFTDLDQLLLASQARDRYKTYRKAFPTGKTSIYIP